MRMELLELTPSQLEVFDWGRGMGVKNLDGDLIQQTLADLKPCLGSALVIGGLAVIHHGYERLTTDVDILYANTDEYDILRRLDDKFKIIHRPENGWHHLENRKTKGRLELIPEGGLTTYGFIPGPHVFKSDDGFLPLWGLYWLKLVSGRSKDETDIIELAKIQMKESLEARAKLDPDLHERFDALIARAQRELKNDPSRLPKR